MARVISPNKSYKQNLMCNEFCGGTQAVCYCPQCSAIFCNECFNREHQTERKRRHEKVFEVRPICDEHKHTLEYFDLTSFQPVCIMCLTKLQIEKQLQFHVIDNIEAVAPKLYTLLGDKIQQAKDVTKTVQDAAKRLKENTEKALNTAKAEVHCLIDHFKQVLDDREREIVVNIEDACKEYVAREVSAGLLSLEQKFHESIVQAERLVQSQEHETIGYEFPSYYNKLSDLCAVASRRAETEHQLKLTVKVSKTTLQRMQDLCEVVPTVNNEVEHVSESDDLETLCNGVVQVKLIDDLKASSNSRETMTTTEDTHHHSNDDEICVDDHESSITPIGDADFYDNEPTNNNEDDVEIVLETNSEQKQTDHHSNIPPHESNSMTTVGVVTPLSSKSARSSPMTRRRRVTFEETKPYQFKKKGKRGRKRQHKPATPMEDTDADTELFSLRELRSSARAKKARTGTQSRTRRGGALSNEMNQCDTILTLLWADDASWPFVRPVDKKKCPEYYEKISNPLCLEIVKEKLHSYQYRSVVNFVRDINQILDNCKTFNEPDSEVYQSGCRLAELFKRLLSENFPNFESIFQDQDFMDSSPEL